MSEKKQQQNTRRLCAGILAHVDAGKTTLSEAMLYLTGSVRKLGRVDHGNAFLDTDAQERQRGITIFSKQAMLSLPGIDVTLLDTPGHVDFSAEMERTLQVSTTDLNQLLFNALLSFESAVEEGGFVIEGFEDLPHIKVQADPELLFQVAYNLFDNAVKFTNKGGTIRVGMEETEGRALVSISNSGKGIPEEEIHRIFERFYKVDKSRSEHVKGVGLGLNLAQDIVELHGGDIYAESEPGGFTSFRFWIPIEKSTDPQE